MVFWSDGILTALSSSYYLLVQISDVMWHFKCHVIKPNNTLQNYLPEGGGRVESKISKVIFSYRTLAKLFEKNKISLYSSFPTFLSSNSFP